MTIGCNHQRQSRSKPHSSLKESVMASLLFFTCLAIVLLPILAIFIFVIATSSQLVILSIGSSFFWLISMLISTLFEPILPAWVIILISVFIQEVVRLGFWKLYDHAYNKGFFKDDKSKTTTFMAAVAIGWGFGFTNTMLTYVAALAHATGPGLLPSPACPSISVFYINGFITLAVSLAHVVWNMIAFDGYNQTSYWRPIFVLLVHLSTAMATVIITGFSGSCGLSMAVVYILLLLAVYVLWWTITRDNSLISRRWERRTR